MTFVLENISLSVGPEAVIDDVSLTLDRGSMNVVLGPTLSGKTTLMRLMAGLDRPTTGRLIEGGVDVTNIPVRRRSVAMVYQQFVNYPSLTVYENIASPLRVAGLGRAEIDARVNEAARLLRLDNFLQRLPAQLSGGQQQRTAIARALVKRAKLVLLDEPLANLDYKLREELREELPRIFVQTGAVLVYATTEPTEALLLGGTTITLHEGRVSQVGPTALVYRRPENIEAARVFSDPPLNELVIEKRGAVVSLQTGRNLPLVGALSTLPDGVHRIGFRADAVAIGDAPSPGLNFQGEVKVTELSGSESFVHVDVGIGVWVCLAPGVHEWQPGAHVEARGGRESRLCLRRLRQTCCDAVHCEDGLRGEAMTRITLDGIAHAYGGKVRSEADYALKPLHHVWEQGMAYALLGPSGCGKTTLLNIISGLVTPSEGRLLFDDVDVTHLPTKERNIAQVFQFPVIYDTMTVAENLAFPLKNRRLPRAAIERRVAEIAAMLDLTGVLDRRARGLTADAKQKISLGRGLVRSDVSAVLFDEPLTVIDPALKWELRSKLKAVHRALDLLMIYVTHDQIEALTFADRVVVMNEGKAVQIGTPDDLFERPEHTFVGYFIGSPGIEFMPARVFGFPCLCRRRGASTGRGIPGAAERPPRADWHPA